MSGVSVNTSQAKRMAERLTQLGWQTTQSNLVQALPKNSTREQALDYFFFTSMLLFDFKNLHAELPDGSSKKGTDLFYYLTRRAEEEVPNFWSAKTLSTLPASDFYRAFSVARAEPDISRMEERYVMLQDAAQTLLEHYDGSTSHLLRQHPALRTADQQGLLDVIDIFEGYQDPLHKKIFVCLKAFDAAQLWIPTDPHNLLMPVDYHVIRLALRNGIITVENEELAHKLRTEAAATPKEEHVIRHAVIEAFQIVMQHSGLSVFLVDDIYWLVGRSCCDYSRPPRCKTCDFTDCYVQPAFNYTCPGNCPLATHCLGAKDDAYSSLLEPNITTTYY